MCESWMLSFHLHWSSLCCFSVALVGLYWMFQNKCQPRILKILADEILGNKPTQESNGGTCQKYYQSSKIGQWCIKIKIIREWVSIKLVAKVIHITGVFILQHNHIILILLHCNTWYYYHFKRSDAIIDTKGLQYSIYI